MNTDPASPGLADELASSRAAREPEPMTVEEAARLLGVLRAGQIVERVTMIRLLEFLEPLVRRYLKLLALPFEALPDEPHRFDVAQPEGDYSAGMVPGSDYVRSEDHDSLRELLLAERLRSAQFEADLLAAQQQVCGACGKPWDGQKCGQADNGHAFPVCYPVNATAPAGSEPRVPIAAKAEPSGPVADASFPPPLSDEQIRTLKRFYAVLSDGDLVAAQAHHIERLQAKLPPLISFQPSPVREG